MKKSIVMLLIFFAILSCKAQIIAVEDFKDYPGELSEGTYVKDVNNILEKYVGTWIGTMNNTNYEFRVEKHTRISDIRNLKFDKLLVRYKITDSSGSVIAHSLNLPNDHKYVIRGSYLDNSTTYVLSYLGLNGKCGQNGTIYISVDGNIMKLGLYVAGEVYSDCTTGPAAQVLPTDGIELTKQ